MTNSELSLLDKEKSFIYDDKKHLLTGEENGYCVCVSDDFERYEYNLTIFVKVKNKDSFKSYFNGILLPKNAVNKLLVEDDFIQIFLRREVFFQEKLVLLINLIENLCVFLKKEENAPTVYRDLFEKPIKRVKKKKQSEFYEKPDIKSFFGVLAQIFCAIVSIIIFIFTVTLSVYWMPWVFGAFTPVFILSGYFFIRKRIDFFSLISGGILALFSLFFNCYSTAGIKLVQTLDNEIRLSLWEGMKLYPEISALFIETVTKSFIAGIAAFTLFVGVYYYRSGNDINK